MSIISDVEASKFKIIGLWNTDVSEEHIFAILDSKRIIEFIETPFQPLTPIVVYNNTAYNRLKIVRNAQNQ